MSDGQENIESLLQMLREFGELQYGAAVKSYWVYHNPLCPCCLAREVGVLEYEGEPAVSANVFMYRERGVLIAYFLCPVCAKDVMQPVLRPASSMRWQMKLHQIIERNLIAAYKCEMASNNA
jgi:hypothetical protein